MRGGSSRYDVCVLNTRQMAWLRRVHTNASGRLGGVLVDRRGAMVTPLLRVPTHESAAVHCLNRV